MGHDIVDDNGDSRPLFIAGHSHVYAFKFNSIAPDESSLLVKLDFPRDNVFGFARIGGAYKDTYWEALIEEAEHKDILIFWLGSQHLAEFLFEEGETFDFIVSSHPEIPPRPGVQIVPESLVRVYQTAFFKGLDDILSRLKARPGCRVFVGATAPPKGDDSALRAFMNKEKHFQDRAELLSLDIATTPLTPRATRLKLWFVIDELLQELANKHQIPYLPVPAKAVDEEGYLRMEYWEDDVGHANIAYGELFFKEAMPLIEKRER